MTYPNGMLTGPGTVDALLSGKEFLLTMHKPDLFAAYCQHTMWPYAKAGTYSDDTQLTLAVAEWMLDESRGLEATMADVYTRDIRGGSPRMKDAFEFFMRNGHFPKDFVKTDGSGAAMRSSLYGLRYRNAEQVREIAARHAMITHSGDGVLAAEAAALLAFYLRKQTPKEELGKRLVAELRDERFNVTEMPKRSGNKGIPCVQAAIWFLQTSSGFREMVQGIADLGGDTDTVGVIAMGAAWFSTQYVHDLPWSMWWDFEDGPYGRSYLRKIEMELLGRPEFSWLKLRTC